MGDDDIIDLDRYRAEHAHASDDTGVSLFGADGPTQHLALPLWRMGAVSQAAWSGIVRSDGGRDPRAVTVVDLASIEAREVPPGGFPDDPMLDPPALIEGSDGTIILAIGAVGGASWYIVLTQRSPGPIDARMRIDLLFLAGECAGLVAGLARESQDPF